MQTNSCRTDIAGITTRIYCVLLCFALAAPASILAATAPDHHQRTLTTLRMLCDGLPEQATATAFPQSNLSTPEAITRGTVSVGSRTTLRFADGSQAIAERFAPGGNLRRYSVQYNDAQSLPLLLVLATPDCSVRNARAIRYENGQAVHLQQLDARLDPVGDTIPVNPPLPPGSDAHGTTVALVDSGVNYLLPQIATHLARDTRGEPLGFDFWDMDTRPFDAHPVHSPFFPQRHGTRIASIILREAPGTRLVPYRYPRPDMQRMRELIEHAAAAGVRIVNLSLGGNRGEEWQVFEQTARQHSQILFIVSAGNNGRDIDRQAVYPASLDLTNMLTVTSADADGYPARGSNWGRTGVDLLVPGEQIPAIGFAGAPRDVSGSSYAAARVTALASRILLETPELKSPELRARIIAMAQPAPDDLVSSGWIVEPADLAREHDLRSLQIVSRSGWPGIDTNYDRFRPTLVMIEDSGWDEDRVRDLVQRSAVPLKQCGITVVPDTLLELAAAGSVRDFSRSNAKLLFTKAGTRGPRIFFVRDTLDRPAFEAFTFGTANSTRNPDLRFTVWLTASAHDPHIALAHEIAHVLLDDGSHSRAPRNLMRSDTTPGNLELTGQQCDRMRDTARRNGLLS